MNTPHADTLFASPLLGSLTLGPVAFDRPTWLLLLIPVIGLTLWWGRKSLSGLGSRTKQAALVIRVLVLLALVGTLAQPSIQWKKKGLDIVFLLDVSRSVPASLQERARDWIESASKQIPRAEDRLEYITVAGDARVQLLATRAPDGLRAGGGTGPTEASALADGAGLALSIRNPDSARRIILATDGNETRGNLLEAARAAKAVGVPIDVLPLPFVTQSEILVDELVAPSTGRMGEVVTLKAAVTNTQSFALRGRLNLEVNGEAYDLSPDEPAATGAVVTLDPGLSVFPIPVTMRRGGPQEFKVVFEPENLPGQVVDTRTENNRASAITFVSGEGRVLLLSESHATAEPLRAILARGKIVAEVMRPDRAPSTLVGLNAYDAIVLVDTPVYAFSQQQIEELRRYVHDGGGGLMMVGGPNAFGAGGWIGSTLEDVLPVKLDPPQKDQRLRGALVLVIHSIEMPEGTYYGKKIGEAAVDALTRLDMAGIIEYNWGAGGEGATWVHPLTELGDKVAIKQAINNLTFGDMPSFDPSLQQTLQALSNVEAGQKHAIVISDGDPSLNAGILQRFKKAQITISAVGVNPHSPADLNTLNQMATVTGGKFYAVSNTAVATIPEIIFAESKKVARPLIWEGNPISPVLEGQLLDSFRGIRGVPPISGYVLTARRDGLATVTLSAPNEERDPIAAQWQHGLGRTAVFTSDIMTRWTTMWGGWGQIDAFWEQQIRWIMRPSGTANVRTTLVPSGDRVRVMVDMTDQQGQQLNFAQIKARVSMPDGSSDEVLLRQVGPGQYHGEFESTMSGSYSVAMKYVAPNPGDPGGSALEGSIQAAVTRPFADEYRALRDNSALLRQVAEMTGGRVLDLNQNPPQLWERENLKMPVSKTAVWLVATLVGLSVFLLDVAVRRVRIDVAGMARAGVGLFRRAPQQASAQIGALKAAREKSRETIQKKTEPSRGTAEHAGVKFDVSDSELRSRMSKPQSVTDAPAPIVQKSAPKDEGKPAGKEEDGMSRLLKAKKRAQDEIQDE